MADDVLRFHQEQVGSARRIVFDHAPTRNALDRVSRVRLVSDLQRLDADPAVTTVILTGIDPAFTSGADARQLLGAEPYDAPKLDVPTMLRAMTTPTIAAVNGACISGGLEIALACAFIVASDRARFADTHARLGLSPGWGLSAALPSAIGVRRARQLALTGELIDAETALRWGLVSEVVAHDALQERTEQLAAAMARIAPAALAHTMALYADGEVGEFREALERERTLLALWHVDRAGARDSFAQTVSPPST